MSEKKCSACGREGQIPVDEYYITREIALGADCPITEGSFNNVALGAPCGMETERQRKRRCRMSEEKTGKIFNHFVCECGREIYFTNLEKPIVKEWIKYHKPHMKKYLKGTYNEAIEILKKEALDE